MTNKDVRMRVFRVGDKMRITHMRLWQQPSYKGQSWALSFIRAVCQLWYAKQVLLSASDRVSMCGCVRVPVCVSFISVGTKKRKKTSLMVWSCNMLGMCVMLNPKSCQIRLKVVKCDLDLWLRELFWYFNPTSSLWDISTRRAANASYRVARVADGRHLFTC